MADIFDLFKQISTSSSASGKPEYIVAGLGNPGSEYEKTRHNAGFMAIDVITEKTGAKVRNSKYKSLTDTVKIGEHTVLLMKPQTYMNLSGEAVQQAAAFYKVKAENIIVVSDEVSLPIGKLRIRQKGSAGGHNGLKNIIQCLGTDQFPRIRMGVGGPPHPDYDMADWVLSNFSKDDQAALAPALDNAASAAETIITSGTAEASNRFNSAGA